MNSSRSIYLTRVEMLMEVVSIFGLKRELLLVEGIINVAATLILQVIDVRVLIRKEQERETKIIDNSYIQGHLKCKE